MSATSISGNAFLSQPRALPADTQAGTQHGALDFSDDAMVSARSAVLKRPQTPAPSLERPRATSMGRRLWQAAYVAGWAGLMLSARAAAATTLPSYNTWPYGTFGANNVCYGIWRTYDSNNDPADPAGLFSLVKQCGNFVLGPCADEANILLGSAGNCPPSLLYASALNATDATQQCILGKVGFPVAFFL